MSLSLSRKAKEVKPSSTLAITAKANELRAKGLDVVGFGAGEPDFKTPENIKDAAHTALDNNQTKYTAAAGLPALRQAVCDKFKRFNGIEYTPAQVVISNGGKHTLMNAFQAILNPGDEVIIPAPFWLSYPEMVKLADGTPVFVKCGVEQNYKITAEQLAAACNENTKAFVLTSPSNPTGMMYTKEELEALAKVIVEKDIYVISDEIYENLIYDDNKAISIASLNEDIYKHTITCCGVAKGYAMTGWRIGYCGAPADVAKLMGAVQSHQTSNPNTIAQYAAIEALSGPQESIEVMRKEFDKRRCVMFERLSSMPYIKTVKPQGAFYSFVDVSEVLGKKHNDTVITDISVLAQILIEEYLVAVIPCTDFGFPDHVRLSYAISLEQINKGLDRIEKFLNNVK
jgi:aspartate aminotransferase